MNSRFVLAGFVWVALSFVTLVHAQDESGSAGDLPVVVVEPVAADEADALVPVAEALETPAPEAVAEATGATASGLADEILLPQESALPAAEPEILMQETLAGLHDLSPWGMYLAADWVVKFVMILLLLASVLSWAVCFYKAVQLYVARQLAARLLAQVAVAGSFEDARSQVARWAEAGTAPAATATQTGLSRWLARFQPVGGGDGWSMIQATALELKLSDRNRDDESGLKERVAARLERVQVSAIGAMNKGTGILATIGAVAPFVGLFGTVWGIMNSFIGIAKSQTTNLAVVAPGIAEALLATAIGLVAAIPAVVIYNHFARSIGVYRNGLGDIATALLILVSRDLGYLKTAAAAPRKQTVAG